MKLKKTLSVMLSVVMFLSLIPSFSVHAEEEPQLTLGMFNDGEIYDVIAEADYIPPDLLKNLSLRKSDVPEYMENTNLRESNAVVRLKNKEDDLSVVKYLNSDGTISDYVMAENVKYEKDGKIYDKSNKLVLAQEDEGYTNPENDITVKMPLVCNESSGIKLNYNDYIIEILPTVQQTELSLNAVKKTDENGDFVVYNDVFGENIDVEYHACLSGIKENVVLNEPTSSNDFEFTVKTNGLLFSENGTFYDGEEPVFTMGELIIYDSNNNPGTGSLTVSEVEYSKTYKYTIHVNEEFLYNENTVYPVIVDPYITGYTYNSSLKDVEICSNSSNVNPTSNTVHIGRKVTGGVTIYSRTFYKSTYISNHVSSFTSTNLSHAYLYFRNITTFNNYITVQVSPVTVSWSETQTTLSPNPYNSIVNTNYTSYLYSGTTSRYLGVNIKSLLLKFNDNTYNAGNGFCLKLKTENNSSDLYTYYSADHSFSFCKPYLVIITKGSSNTNQIKNKGLYKVTNGDSQTILKVKNGNSYVLSYDNANVTVGSTENRSPFMAFNEVSGNDGVYTLSFISSKQENKQLYLHYYNQNNSLSLSECTDGTTDVYDYWYVIRFIEGTLPLYRLVNMFDSRYFITSDNLNCVSSTSSKWMLSFVGLDVPLIQQLPDYCGPCSVLQTLLYFNEQNLISDYSSYPGNNIYEKYQNALGNKMGTTPDGTAYGRIISFYRPQSENNIYGNTYGINHDYSAYNKNIINTKKKIFNYIKNSIDSEFPVILHAHSSVFNYYGSGGRHFICLVGYTVTSEYDSDENMYKVNYIVRDCNNADIRFGEHIVTGDEIMNMLNYNISPLRTVICKTFN